MTFKWLHVQRVIVRWFQAWKVYYMIILRSKAVQSGPQHKPGPLVPWRPCPSAPSMCSTPRVEREPRPQPIARNSQVKTRGDNASSLSDGRMSQLYIVEYSLSLCMQCKEFHEYCMLITSSLWNVNYCNRKILSQEELVERPKGTGRLARYSVGGSAWNWGVGLLRCVCAHARSHSGEMNCFQSNQCNKWLL